MPDVESAAELFATLGNKARVFASPGRYVQGPGVLDELGRIISHLEAETVGVLASPRRKLAEEVRFSESLALAGIDCHFAEFGGEASFAEIELRTDEIARGGADILIGFGGGKCIDTAKGVAHRLEVPLVVVPSLASNDGPCSASSVIYEEAGNFAEVEFYPKSPDMVLVDTQLIAETPARYLAAGMGDAMATWYEADVVARNPNAVSTFGARPTLASLAIAKTCAEVLFRDGPEAMQAAQRSEVNDPFENVVEANILLSGIGFESGGLAAAHGIGMSLTILDRVHTDHLHGEMVAFGLLAQLILEDRLDEAARVGSLFRQVGLPTRLTELSVEPDDHPRLQQVAEGAAVFPFTSNMECPTSASDILGAIQQVDSLDL